MKRHARFWQGALSLAALMMVASCALLSVTSLGLTEPIQRWTEIGPLQILGGPDELWIFAEKRTVVRLPGWLVSAPVRDVDHHQEVIVIDATGHTRRIVVTVPGPTFHTNIGRIVRTPDGFRLIEGPSMSTRRSVFLWTDDHFVLMPFEDSEPWLKNVGLDALSPAETKSAIDQFTVESGWLHLFEARDSFFAADGAFEWNGRQFKMRVEDSAQERCSIVAEEWPLEIMIFDFPHVIEEISREELDAQDRTGT